MADSMDDQIGSLLSMGFEGTTITPQVKSLIENYRVGTICLQAKNLKSKLPRYTIGFANIFFLFLYLDNVVTKWPSKCVIIMVRNFLTHLIGAPQAMELITSLQKVAYGAGYTEPLLISLDQENGGVNSIFDHEYFHQFPSAMGLAACRSRELTRSVSRAAGKELACIGVNWLVGPVFDVHSNTKPQPMGVRCFGEYPEIVAEQALESMLGYQEGGLLTCIKHFPGFGSLDFVGSPADIPNVSGTFDQLLSTSLVPFQAAIDNGVDSILVGACGMPDAQVPYSCLSYTVVTSLLRRRMGFGGVILSDCLEIEALYEGVGVSQAAAMAINAGCDVIMLCQSHSNQIEAIQGIKTAIESGLLSVDHIQAAAGRVRKMKQRKLSWEQTWNPGGLSALDVMRPAHKLLSRSVYNASITLVRDLGNYIPLTKKSAPTDVLLLLTPLVEPFGRPSQDEQKPQQDSSLSHATPSKLINSARHLSNRRSGYLEGESTFQELGVALAKRWRGKVVHTSYTASGISPLHEHLVSEASAVILLTADGVRNVYQYGFTKYILSLCQGNRSQFPTASSIAGSPDKPCIVVAVSSPYDFMNDRQVTTYLCTYDLTGPSLNTLVRVLFGKLKATGLPPTIRQTFRHPTIQRQLWLVEKFDFARDSSSLQEMFDQVRMVASNSFSDPEAQYPSYCFETSSYQNNYQPLFKMENFIVRNSSTQTIYGFCATYYSDNLSRGIIAAIVVSTSHRGKGIGFSLHQYALHNLQRRRIEVVQFGSEIPVIFPGIPNRLSTHQLGLRSWVKNRGWDVGSWNHHDFYAIRLATDSLPTMVPEKSAVDNGLLYDTIQPQDQEELNQHLLIQTCFGASSSLLHHPVVLSELYRCAQTDSQGCKILLARTRDARNSGCLSGKGKIIGSMILYHASSQMSKYFPVEDRKTGGLVGVVSLQGAQAVPIVEGLIRKALHILIDIGFNNAQTFIIQFIHLFW
ncbi:conserved hypothetical protein [Talaromyces stipitatus ATCC 10500]|uniref:Beta-N-acetylglucosaminidase n=1 Tax=Talaromyces stipitatus (strain ATCC 10500 / CBS 375.48 / QM 6759 / NRRL 1006) TaxID=441959 RepID=B8MQX6_TALSN|nr:uncharacterized protein TSTA_053290 [Talaromyces stipitatus ATCC 10500]EED12811.1 conserved hypothetical protein [Talaromyces stipitatus ATCC 10500]